MRRLAGVVVVTLLIAIGSLGATRVVKTYRVACTATTSHLAVAFDHGRNVTATNMGTINVYVGGGGDVAPHQTLHVGTSLEFKDLQGGLICNTAGGYGGTGSSNVDVTEEIP